MSFLQAIPIDGFPYFRKSRTAQLYLLDQAARFEFLAQHGLSENEFRDLVEDGMEAEEKAESFNEPIRQNISQREPYPPTPRFAISIAHCNYRTIINTEMLSRMMWCCLRRCSVQQYHPSLTHWQEESLRVVAYLHR